MTKDKRYRNEKVRSLLAFTMAMDPGVSRELRHFIRMGVYDIHHDYMLIRNPSTDKYDRVPDPGAWYGTLKLPHGEMGLMLLRSKDGSWFLNGC